MSTTEQVQASAGAKKTGRRNGITNIVVDRIDGKHLREVMRAVGLEFSEDASDDGLSVQLHNYFAEHYPADALARCDSADGCGGASPIDGSFTVCPYCGQEDSDAPPAAEAKESPAEEAERVAEELKASVPTASKKAPGPKKAKAPAPPAEAKVNGHANGQANGHANGHVNGTSTAMVKVGGPLTLATVKSSLPSVDVVEGQALDVARLDQWVEEFRGQRGRVVMNVYVQGLMVRRFLETKIYLQRLDEKGEQKFKTFDSFCHAELNMRPTTAKKSAAMVEEFTEEEFWAFGRKKIEIILQAAPEDRQRVKEMAQKNESRRAIEKEVRKANKERAAAGEKRADRKGTEKSIASQSRAEKSPKQLTVANIVGTQTVKLFKLQGTSIPKVWDESKMVRAKSLKDTPVGRLELTNGVHQFFRLTLNAESEIAIKVITEREK
jgi:hypothetical protein